MDQNKIEDFNIKHELLRRKIWINRYLQEGTSTINFTRAGKAAADEAVRDFDTTFIPLSTKKKK